MLSLILCSALASAQFPPPRDFQIQVRYITIDQSDWCGAYYVAGPNYCNLMHWQAPDTAGLPATLTGYRIYYDSLLFLVTDATAADTLGGFIGTFFATAVYADPAGESGPSNLVLIEDLPIATQALDQEKIEIRYDPAERRLLIEGAELARALRVYNVQGIPVYAAKAVHAAHPLSHLLPGAYWVAVQDKWGKVTGKMVLVGL